MVQKGASENHRKLFIMYQYKILKNNKASALI